MTDATTFTGPQGRDGRRGWTGFLGLALLWILAIVGLLALLTTGAVVLGAWAVIARLESPPAPEEVVLRIDLREGVVDGRPADGFSRVLADDPPALHDLVEAIDLAAEDERVTLLVAEFGGETVGFAATQEIGDAIGRFQAAGKPAVALANSFGELGGAMVAYALASRFDEIRIQPVGFVGLTGVSAEVPLAREALEKLGVDPQFTRRGPYKTAVDPFLHEGLTPEHRETLESLVEDRFDQLMAAISSRRALPRDRLRALVDRAPIAARDALDAGLVDALEHRADAMDALMDQRPDAQILGTRAYLGLRRPASDRIGLAELGIGGAEGEERPRVAIVYGTGTIFQGSSDQGGGFGLSGRSGMGSDTIARAFEDAVEAGVEAIVFRVNSGGGSAIASDQIRRALIRAKEAGIPVVVSMGSVAASGGYWISADADRILAQPGTVTGSIGVFAGKLAFEETWERLGVAWGRVEIGDQAGLWSPQRSYSTAQRARLDALVDGIYSDFLDVVAEGRGLDRAAVDALAQGRVWTGRQALARGLVDGLGGLDEALSTALELADLQADAVAPPLVLPRRPSPVDRVRELTGLGVDASRVVAGLGPILALVAGPLEGVDAARRGEISARMVGPFGPPP